MKYSDEAAGEPVVACRDGAIDVEPAEGALDASAPAAKILAPADRLLAVSSTRDHRREAASNEIVKNVVTVVALVGEQCAGRAERQRHQRIVALTVRRFAAGEEESERSTEGVTDTTNFSGEPAPRAAKLLFVSPLSAPEAGTWLRAVVEAMQ